MKTTEFTTKEVQFNSQGLILQGMLYLQSNTDNLPAVIICHPHPQYGGSMDNNVVESLCESLAAAGIIALKFNFRGVGASQGAFDNGRGEQTDVQAALEFLLRQPEVDQNRLGLVGYSAGAAWGLSAVREDIRIKALAAISPPLEMFDFGFMWNCQKPALLISGSLDNLISAENIQIFCAAQPLFLTCQIVPESDHSWLGYEHLLTEQVTQFFSAKFPQNGTG